MVTCPRHTYFRIRELEHKKDTATGFETFKALADLGTIFLNYYRRYKKEIIDDGLNFEDENPDLDNQISFIEDCIEILNTPPTEHSEIVGEDMEHREVYFQDNEKVSMMKASKVVMKFINAIRDCLEPAEEAVDRSYEFTRPDIAFE